MAKKKELQIATGIRAMMRRQPFLPFDIKTSGGDTFHAFHPEFIMLPPHGETLVMYDKNFHFRFVNLRQVVNVEHTRPKKGLLGQGGGKR